jgi:hypothetical protein
MLFLDSGSLSPCRLLSLSFRALIRCLYLVFMYLFCWGVLSIVGFFGDFIYDLCWIVTCNSGDVWFKFRCDCWDLFMHVFWILLRCSVCFLNICYICLFYRFNRNRALHNHHVMGNLEKKKKDVWFAKKHVYVGKWGRNYGYFDKYTCLWKVNGCSHISFAAKA